MPKVPSISPATGQPTSSSFIHTLDFNFVDNAGRTLLLRGVNLSGASKAPVGHLSYLLEDFWESAEEDRETFVGRPLNLDDGSADVHLARLRGWGFNFLRFPFTWEALEHAGPGKYDYEFMDYLIRVLCKCRDYGFRVYMDPHQDTWSRFSGGSGAPFWTLAACGIDPRNITATQAAILHCEYPLANEPNPAQLPAMLWSTNYGHLLSQTVFTLFFAGRDFAPNCIIDGVNIQDYLQNHYIEAVARLAERIRDFESGSLFEECIIGWDSLNEPFEGLCEWEDLNVNPNAQGSTLKKGTFPTPAQSLRLGMGQVQTVDHWSFGALGPSRDGSVTIDPKGRKLWATAAPPSEEPHDSGACHENPDGVHPKWGWKRDVSKWPLGTCIWAQHGVWDVETGYILRPDYFKFNPSTGEDVEFMSDYWKPHWVAFSKRLRQAHPEAIIFVQPPVFAPPPRLEEEDVKGRCAYSPHYYDGLTLVTRHWNWFNADALGLLRGKYSSTYQAVKIGASAIRKSLQQQLGYLKADMDIVGPYPTLIGEIGTPFDMDQKKSYGWTDGGKHKGDYSNQEKALDASLNGCDGINGLNYTIWTYVPDDHTHEWGDGWNMEDLSLWSYDDLIDDGESWRRFADEGDAESLYRAADSRAGLLDKQANPHRTQLSPSLPMNVAAAASSVSLATLGGVSTANACVKRFRSKAPSFQQDSLAGWSPNPFEFLTNGARAVRAFARPWPTKVIGRPVDMKFDIGKASFKLVVSVRPEDRPNEHGLGAAPLAAKGGGSVEVVPVCDDAASIRTQEEGNRQDQLSTEVYIPLVHYAHPRLLQDPMSRIGRQRRRHDDGDAHSIASTSSSTSDGPRIRGRLPRPVMMTAMTTTTTLHANPSESDDDSGSPASIQTAVNPADLAKPLEDLQSSTPRLIEDVDDLVDIEVKVSAGTWLLQGQTLRWWYDVPREGEGVREYTLEVKRRGGVVKVKDEERDCAKSICAQLCPDDGGCVVM